MIPALIAAVPSLINIFTKDNIKTKTSIAAAGGAIAGGVQAYSESLPVVAELIMKYKPVDNIYFDTIAWVAVFALALNWKSFKDSFAEAKKKQEAEL